MIAPPSVTTSALALVAPERPKAAEAEAHLLSDGPPFGIILAGLSNPSRIDSRICEYATITSMERGCVVPELLPQAARPGFQLPFGEQHAAASALLEEIHDVRR